MPVGGNCDVDVTRVYMSDGCDGMFKCSRTDYIPGG
jgi:hypothetical protein